MVRKGAKRYARAVFEIAQERKELDRWQSDLRRIAAFVDSALIERLEDPRVHFDRKVELLAVQLRNVNPLALNLVYLLTNKGRLYLIQGITEEYQNLLDSYRGIEHAEVATAVPLDAEDERHLAERIGAILGKKVVLKARVDPGIIGGVLAKIEYKVLDASVTGRLQALKRELVK